MKRKFADMQPKIRATEAEGFVSQKEQSPCSSTSTTRQSSNSDADAAVSQTDYSNEESGSDESVSTSSDSSDFSSDSEDSEDDAVESDGSSSARQPPVPPSRITGDLFHMPFSELHPDGHDESEDEKVSSTRLRLVNGGLLPMPSPKFSHHTDEVTGLTTLRSGAKPMIDKTIAGSSSVLLNRLQKFLPRMKEANEALDEEARAGKLHLRKIEVDDNDGKGNDKEEEQDSDGTGNRYIEMVSRLIF